MIGTILAELSVFCVQYLFTRKDFPTLQYLKSGIIFFPIGALMGIIVWIVGQILGPTIITLIIQIILGAFIYGIGSLIYLIAIKETYSSLCSKRLFILTQIHAYRSIDLFDLSINEKEK